MIEDARSLSPGETVIADVCVVGAGVAGITLGLDLAGRGLSVVVLEGGGVRRSASSDALYDCRVEGTVDDYSKSRSRYLGGSSNCWTGWCQPISRTDMASRDWVRASGWPVAHEDLIAHARRAAAILEVDPDLDLANALERAPDGADVLPLSADKFRTTLSLISPPTRLGTIYRDAMRRADRLRVILHANVVEIVPAPNPALIDSVAIRTLQGGTARCRARHFVLAAGGIENARLLLASKGHGERGIGNGRDLVGRYFMDHPRVRAGLLTLKDPSRFSRLYDSSYFRTHVPFGLSLTVADELAARERLLPCQIGFRAVFVGEDTLRAIRLRDALGHGAATAKARAAIVADPLRTAGSVLPNAFAYGLRKASVRRMIKHFVLETVVEPEPDPDNRVTLSTARDLVGMPKAAVRWSVGDLERRSLARALDLMRDELQSRGLGRVVIETPPEEREILSTSHHMGTTRMHPDPARGVVDPDGRVHGIGNLHVTGSSVFPTGLVGPPTMTIVMLALRLGARLAETHRADGFLPDDRPAVA
ncbi:FAD-dependent oxidoreductase [Chthonobacter rhizosphaerae]|uniref:FAD-dependent oxidoreductase n=1 Tax=Chthonobacter rhizosphaerae TaxID=2735553 RepID=UPI0015EE8434|nr:GMC family oxidoreductase [Chthonobacter rhizosphaerae]